MCGGGDCSAISTSGFFSLNDCDQTNPHLQPPHHPSRKAPVHRMHAVCKYQATTRTRTTSASCPRFYAGQYIVALLPHKRHGVLASSWMLVLLPCSPAPLSPPPPPPPPRLAPPRAIGGVSPMHPGPPVTTTGSSRSIGSFPSRGAGSRGLAPAEGGRGLVSPVPHRPARPSKFGAPVEGPSKDQRREKTPSPITKRASVPRWFWQ